VNFVDPDGNHPVIAGAIIGGAISGTAAIIKGKSFTEVVAATAGGAVDGVISTLGCGVGGKLFMGAVGGGAGSYVEQFINKTFGNRTEINEAEIIASATFGAVTGTIEGAGDNLGKYIKDFYSSDETVKSIAKEIKDNSSKKMTNKQSVVEAKKVAEEAKQNEKDIAEKTGFDISTISRVVNSKYIETHFGIYSLKYFFSEGLENQEGEEVSTRELKKALQECVDGENKRKPFTDDELVEKMTEKGYKVARRTIAKYRDQLGIPKARLRKEL
jgi:hypothetical protein